MNVLVNLIVIAVFGLSVMSVLVKGIGLFKRLFEAECGAALQLVHPPIQERVCS